METVSRKCLGKMILFACGILMAFLPLCGCAPTSTCDRCGKTFSGNGYYDILRDSSYTLCADCAKDYYEPFPYEPYEKA